MGDGMDGIPGGQGQPLTNGVSAEYQIKPEDVIMVRTWFDSAVKLPQYHQLFISNGYERLDIIKHIANEAELREIGVGPVEHQNRFMIEIKKLNGIKVDPMEEKKDKEKEKKILKYRHHKEEIVIHIDGDNKKEPQQNEPDIVKDEKVPIIQQEQKQKELEQEQETLAIKLWLTEIVRLPKLIDVFVNHGYESMDLIKTITDKSELKNIGITKLGHQTRILAKIKDLNAMNY